MDPEGILYSIINRLFRLSAGAIILSVLGFVVLWFLLSYTFIKIDVRYNDGISKPATLTALANEKSSKLLMFGDIALIPRAATSIQAVSDSYKTIQTINLPIVGMTSTSLVIQKDKNATFYSDESKDCLSYNQAGDALSSYDCTNTTAIYSYKAPADGQVWQLSQDATLMPSHSVTTYMGGVIGVNSTDIDKPIFYRDSSGAFTYLPLPSDADKSKALFATVTTDKINALNPHFILTTYIGDIYLGTLSGGTVTYTKYNHPTGYSTGSDATLCNLQDTIAYCYQGASSTAPNAEGASAHIGHLVALTFASSKVDYTSYETPSSFSADKLFVDGQQNMYALAKGNVYGLTKQGGKLNPVILANNITSADVGNDLFFVQSNDVYEVSSSNLQATLRFHSYRITPTSVYALGRDVFVNGTASDAGDTQRTYKLTDDAHTLAARPVDVLPFSISSSPDISDMSVFKDTVLVLLKVTVAKKADSAADAVNSGEIATAKKNVLDQLVSAGIDLSKTTVLFTY